MRGRSFPENTPQNFSQADFGIASMKSTRRTFL